MSDDDQGNGGGGLVTIGWVILICVCLGQCGQDNWRSEHGHTRDEINREWDRIEREKEAGRYMDPNDIDWNEIN